MYGRLASSASLRRGSLRTRRLPSNLPLLQQPLADVAEFRMILAVLPNFDCNVRLGVGNPFQNASHSRGSSAGSGFAETLKPLCRRPLG